MVKGHRPMKYKKTVENVRKLHMRYWSCFLLESHPLNVIIRPAYDISVCFGTVYWPFAYCIMSKNSMYYVPKRVSLTLIDANYEKGLT